MIFKIIQLLNTPIYDQLCLEEMLLKNSLDNYAIINLGSPPAIVLGISGKIDELVYQEKVPAHIPLIRRFSGGGTVIVDEQTVFVTFICNKSEHPFLPYPEPILRWAHSILSPVTFHFELIDNDFALHGKKCGGNALYIKKDRWLVHTSFLWDYTQEHMQLLKHPLKTPDYRKNRTHDEFLCKLKEYLPCQKQWRNDLTDRLISQGAAPIESDFLVPAATHYSTQLIIK